MRQGSRPRASVEFGHQGRGGGVEAGERRAVWHTGFSAGVWGPSGWGRWGHQILVQSWGRGKGKDLQQDSWLPVWAEEPYGKHYVGDQSGPFPEADAALMTFSPADPCEFS